MESYFTNYNHEIHKVLQHLLKFLHFYLKKNHCKGKLKLTKKTILWIFK